MALEQPLSLNKIKDCHYHGPWAWRNHLSDVFSFFTKFSFSKIVRGSSVGGGGDGGDHER